MQFLRWMVFLACVTTPMFAAFSSSISVSGSGVGTLAGNGISFTASGTAVLGGFGTGTFTASGQASVDPSGTTGPVMATFTLDFTGGNTLTGTLSIPAGIVAPQLGGDVNATGSLTITGGTGGFAGTTGSFPKVAGSGRATGLTTSQFQFSGDGSLNLGPTTAPPPSITAVLNSGSGDSRLSPGCVATVSGTNLSGQSAVVQVSGKAAAVINATAGLLTIEIPVDAAAGQPLVLSEKRDGFTSNNVNITLDVVAPAILAGTGSLGGFFHLNGTAVTADSPATPGETIRAAAVCMGPTNPQIATGAKTPISPPVTTVLAPTVTVGGAAANVTSSVAEPNLVGVYSVYFVVPVGLDAKNQAVMLSVTGKNSNVAQLAVGPAVPVVTAIVNGAGFGSLGTVAPGEFATVFGANFGSKDQLGGFPATSFNGVSVTFAGTAAPIFALVASAGQINLITPSELPESGTVSVVAKNPLGVSQTYTLHMTSASPGIFLLPDPTNSNRRNAAALFANSAWRVIPSAMATALGLPSQCRSSGISAAALCGEAATAGDSIEIFTTGLGKATPGGDPAGTPIATGVIAPADGSTLYLAVQKPTVTIGGIAAPVLFAGIAPGTAGLYQVNVTVPQGVAKGDVNVVITMPNGASDTAVIPIV